MAKRGSSGFDPQRLRSHRERAKLTVTQLARQVGISPQAISKYESGRAAPLPDRLSAIAAALKISPRDLIKPGGGLASLRAGAGLLQEQVVAMAGPDMDISRYRHLELGHVHRLTHHDAATLARIFGVEIAQVREAHESGLQEAQEAAGDRAQADTDGRAEGGRLPG